MVSEGRVLQCCPSRLCVGVPSLVCVVAVLKGGGVCAAMPRPQVGVGTFALFRSLVLSRSSSVLRVTVFVVGGEV